jgi:protein subunit release factor A
MAEQDEKTFTQADIDSLMAKHQEEMNALAGKLRAEFKEKEDKAKKEAERLAKEANMSELEKANANIEDLKAKLQQSEDTIALTNQKDETRKLMSELGVDSKCLDYVFIPKDTEGTKARVQAFKEYIDNVKR